MDQTTAHIIMKKKHTQLLNRLSALVVLGSFSSQANAALSITSWDITGSTLTFDISGQIDAGAPIGSLNAGALYIGVPGDNDWISSNSTSRTVTNHAGATRAIGNFPTYTNNPTSDYVSLSSSNFLAWQEGDTVNATITLTGGGINAANINTANIIVTAGTNSFTSLPDPTATVGGFAPAPEPSSSALLGIGALGLILSRRRRS